MKKIFVFAAVLCAFLLLASCAGKEPSADSTKDGGVGVTEDAAPKVLNGVNTAYASWTEDERIKVGEVNGVSGFTDGLKHFPVFVFRTSEELKSFKESFSDVLNLDGTRDGIPSFNEISETYGDAFFEENALAAIYVTSSSGSLRYGVRDASVKDGVLTVDIEQLNDPEVVTADMAGWLFTAELDKSALSEVKAFDAVFVGKAADCGMPD